MILHILCGLPASGKTTLAQKIIESNKDLKYWNVDHYSKYKIMDTLYKSISRNYSFEKGHILDGLFLNNNDYIKIIKDLISNSLKSENIFTFHFHFFIPDIETCLWNDMYRRDESSEITIRNAKVEEPNISLIASSSSINESSIVVEKYQVVKKSEFELFKHKNNVNDLLISDEWSKGGYWVDLYGNEYNIHSYDDLEFHWTSFPEFDDFLNEIFPNASDDLKEELFNKTVEYQSFKESPSYYGGVEYKKRFICNVKTLYEIMDERGLIVMGSLLK